MGTGIEDRLSLSTDLISAYKRAGSTLATAESCTGGLVAAALTDVAGSSAVFLGGVVSYAVPVKEAVLSVPREITRDPEIGVVSSECAEAMAKGVRALIGADIAVSTTGIAGPGGAEPGKPVGTVWFGVSSDLGERSCVRHLTGDRAQVRDAAVCVALRLAADELAALAQVSGTNVENPEQLP